MKIVINGELTDLNSYIKKLNYNRFAANEIKQIETQRVAFECINQKVTRVEKYPVIVNFSWYSKDNRMDIDNVCFAKKFILDGMVIAGVLDNDSRKFVNGFKDMFYVDKRNPRVVVEIET